jgi:hypothetical protein
MDKLSTTRISVAVLTAFVAVAGAQAAQKTTSRCSVTGPGGNVLQHTVGQPAVTLSDVGISVNNTSGVTKNAIVHLAADGGVDANAEMRMTFSMDGGSGAYLGPQNFANHTDFWQTRNTMAVISIPPGVHLIEPQFFVQGFSGATSFIDDRCMTVTF